jgi:hypothetical protein
MFGCMCTYVHLERFERKANNGKKTVFDESIEFPTNKLIPLRAESKEMLSFFFGDESTTTLSD